MTGFSRSVSSDWSQCMVGRISHNPSGRDWLICGDRCRANSIQDSCSRLRCPVGPTQPRRSGDPVRRLAITQRVAVEPNYSERRDCLDQRWLNVLDGFNVALIPVPNSLPDAGRWASALSVEGLILSGGNSLSHIGDLEDVAPERDRPKGISWTGRGSSDIRYWVSAGGCR